MAQQYYHSLIRKYIILFGSLFTDIKIDRTDASGNAVQTLTVPLSYGPKEWYLQKQEENPGLAKEISQTLPRMAFQIMGFRHRAEDQRNKSNITSAGSSVKATLETVKEPVPYDMHIRLSVLTRNADDGTRIVEQILPLFAPNRNESLILIPEMNIVRDIPIILGNVSLDDEYVGSMRDDDRKTVWDLDFVMKVYFYGEVRRSKVIKNIDVSMFGRFDATDPLTKINITPGLTANGQPTKDPVLTISPRLIQKSDNWDFIIQFTEPH